MDDATFGVRAAALIARVGRHLAEVEGGVLERHEGAARVRAIAEARVELAESLLQIAPRPAKRGFTFFRRVVAGASGRGRRLRRVGHLGGRRLGRRRLDRLVLGAARVGSWRHGRSFGAAASHEHETGRQRRQNLNAKSSHIFDGTGHEAKPYTQTWTPCLPLRLQQLRRRRRQPRRGGRRIETTLVTGPGAGSCGGSTMTRRSIRGSASLTERSARISSNGSSNTSASR